MGRGLVKHNFGKLIDAQGTYSSDLLQLARYKIINAPLGVANGIHAAHTDDGAEEVLTTGITNPTIPRNITATAGGVAGDIKAIAVVIEGTNMADEVITETLPAFTVDTAGIVVGVKAFKTVTKITIPAHDDLGATTAIGFGAVLGLPYKLWSASQVLVTLQANTVNAAVLTVSSSAVESNTLTLNGVALNGVIDIDVLIAVQ